MTWTTRDGNVVLTQQFANSGLQPAGCEQAWNKDGCYYRVKLPSGPWVKLTEEVPGCGDRVIYDETGAVLTVMTDAAFKKRFIYDSSVGEPEVDLKPAPPKELTAEDLDQLGEIVSGTGPIRPIKDVLEAKGDGDVGDEEKEIAIETKRAREEQQKQKGATSKK